MTRLEAGAIQVHKRMAALEEVVGAGPDALEVRYATARSTTHLPADLPLVPLDGGVD